MSDPQNPYNAPPGGGAQTYPATGYPQGGDQQDGYGQGGYQQGGYQQGGYPPGMGPSGPVGGPPKRSSNTLLIVAIAVLAVIAIGAIGFVVLGGGDDDGGGGDTAEQRTDLTLDDLRPALLTSAEVPEGFEETEWVDDPNDDLTPEQIDGSAECEEALERFGMADSNRDQAGTKFEHGDTGATIENTLSAPLADDVTLDEVRRAVGECGSFSYDDGETTGDVTMVVESVDGIGDEAIMVTMALQTSAEGYDLRVEMNGIMWDRAGVHASVNYTGGFDPDALATQTSLETQPIDQDALRSAAEAVDAKLAPITDG
jgi:hypothetical protein